MPSLRCCLRLWEKVSMLYSLFVCICVNVIASWSGATRQNGCFVAKRQTASTCGSSYFECLSGECIERRRYCNGRYDCSDSSDENYCESWSSCPSSFTRCQDSQKCIPDEWICDDIGDCPADDDEAGCGGSKGLADSARQTAINWLKYRKQSASATEKWGTLVYKSAVALYLADPAFIVSNNENRKDMAYELSIQLLSRLALKKLENVCSSDLASFINAFLATCVDPRKFYGIDLVQELRTRVDKENYTNPYLFLTLCNANEILVESDVKKLIDAFSGNHHEFWIETQAIIVMALSCARNRSENSVNPETMSNFTMELKQHQYRNGTVENLQTTALVLQALFSAESDEDPDNFDDVKALQQILSHQQHDGSFGSFMKTYYVLPILNCKSLVNISSSHCVNVPKDEDSAFQYLKNKIDPKFRVHFSQWIGLHKDVERTLTMRVPANTSFYEIMEMAADIDPKYKFEYVVKKRKPYVNALAGILDSAEDQIF